MPVFRVKAMTEAEARRICTWVYSPPYAIYDLEPGDVAMFMDSDLNYRAVHDAAGLAGFACYGEDAQVMGGYYPEPALDIGCGMEPGRTGRGQGQAFVAAILDHAWLIWRPAALRLSVATFNRRAIAVYQRAGFRTVDYFTGTTRHGSFPFQTMLLGKG